MVLELPQAAAPRHPYHSSILYLAQLTSPESDGFRQATSPMQLFSNSSGR